MNASGDASQRPKGPNGPNGPASEVGGVPGEIPAALPAWAARAGGWVIILTMAIALALAVALRVPETVRCPFELIPEGGANPMLAPVDGHLRTVHVAEGAEVEAGAPLLEILAPRVVAWRAEAGQLREDVRRLTARRDSLPARHEAEAQVEAARIEEMAGRLAVLRERLKQYDKRIASTEDIYAAELKLQQERIRAYEREIKFLGTYRDTYELYATRIEGLVEKGGVARLDALFQRMSALRAQLEASKATHAQEMEALRLRQVELDRVRQRLAEEDMGQRLQGEIQSLEMNLVAARHDARRNALLRELDGREIDHDLAKTRLRLTALDTLLAQCEADRFLLRAPFDGVVVALHKTEPGAVVSRGEVLCRLARAGAPLVARLHVPPKAQPRLAVGQGVRFLVDAFPYQRHGVRTGALTWISPAATPATAPPGPAAADPATGAGTGGGSFLARARIEDPVVRVDGRPRRLRAGMAGEARITVGRRTLIEYVFEPLRKLRESYRDVPPAREDGGVPEPTAALPNQPDAGRDR